MQNYSPMFTNKFINNQLGKQNNIIHDDNIQIFEKWNILVKDTLNLSVAEYSKDFFKDFFVETLNYNEHLGDDNVNIVFDESVKLDEKTICAQLGCFNSKKFEVQAVVQLWDGNIDLDTKSNKKGSMLSPIEESFFYANKTENKCKWVIISNFREIRLYHIQNKFEYEQFFITELCDVSNAVKFMYLLEKKNLVTEKKESVLERTYKMNSSERKGITTQFYKYYKNVRIILFQSILSENSGIEDFIVLEKTQKLLDRFIFICFCEDKGLLDGDTFKTVIKNANKSFGVNNQRIWHELKGLFHSIDKGNNSMNINKFNGGLFAFDDILDNLIISDKSFLGLEELSSYNFDTDLNVNILGHIFEQSISDIEDIKKSINKNDFDFLESKRKSDGIFYTPESITTYMVENSISIWLEEKKRDIGIYSLPLIPNYLECKNNESLNLYRKSVKSNLEAWKKYSEILSKITIIDPACGSGAFLNAAFDYLYSEGKKVNRIISELTGTQISFFDLNKSILKNNLFGVDINDESIEITKLSLWLKTANKNETLTSLDNNIKCGNSLISDSYIAGKKAFNWQENFREVFENDGFDIVIGNPPYGAKLTSEEKDYLKARYKSTQTITGVQKGSLDTYSVFFELAIEISNSNSYINYIVPMAITSSDSMQGIHKELFKVCSEVKVSSYSSRPAKIFDEADQRISIVTCKKDGKILSNLLTTQVNKRYKEKSISSMLSELEFVNSTKFIKKGRLPKIGTKIERDILEKIFSYKYTLMDFKDLDGTPVYYRTSGGRYYNIITNFPTNSSKEKAIYLESTYRDLIGAILSSNLYYWFCQLYSNNLDIKTYEIDILPIPFENITEALLVEINKIYNSYMSDLDNNSIVSKRKHKEYIARKSKNIIDSLDSKIRDLYDLSDDEINFISNFDCQYRNR